MCKCTFTCIYIRITPRAHIFQLWLSIHSFVSVLVKSANSTVFREDRYFSPRFFSPLSFSTLNRVIIYIRPFLAATICTGSNARRVIYRRITPKLLSNVKSLSVTRRQLYIALIDSPQLEFYDDRL